ncbi:MAG: hypothetical protein R3322_16260 [Kiloniellales bacterium]|nr:hypothetical protein [Kiloniellales bacterium]
MVNDGFGLFPADGAQDNPTAAKVVSSASKKRLKAMVDDTKDSDDCEEFPRRFIVVSGDAASNLSIGQMLNFRGICVARMLQQIAGNRWEH